MRCLSEAWAGVQQAWPRKRLTVSYMAACAAPMQGGVAGHECLPAAHLCLAAGLRGGYQRQAGLGVNARAILCGGIRRCGARNRPLPVCCTPQAPVPQAAAC